MDQIIEVRLPQYPDCWQSCGNCGGTEVCVEEVRVLPGDEIERDDTLIVLETGKVALDIPAPAGGRIVELFVAAGDRVVERQPILRLALRQTAGAR